VNYIVKGKKYIFVLLVLFLISACSVSSIPTPDDTISSLATISISSADQQAAIEKQYGGKAVVFRPEAGFAILGFSEGQLTTLSTSPNATVKSPEVSALGTNAWGGGNKAWGGGWNAWGGGWNSWGGGLGTIPASPAENRFRFKQIHVSEAFTLSKNFGAGFKIAVIDTGIDLTHPMFSGRLAPSTEWKDFVDGDSNPQEVTGSFYGHGTAVAGIVLQIAPKATILPIRVLNSEGIADVAKVANAIDWAIQKGAKVINLSLGTDVDVSALKSMVEYATSLGVYVVASAGNEGNLTTLTYPAQYATSISNASRLISVGSTADTSLLSTFSNRGSALEIAASGEKIYTAYPGSLIGHATGTSFAAPIISGTLALIGSNVSSSDYASLESIIKNGSWAMASGGQHLNISASIAQAPGFQNWRKALFVVGSSTLNAGDQLVNDRLWSLGYSVTIKTGVSATSADATGKDIVVISSTVNSTDVHTKFKSVATPVLTWDPWLYDDMGLTSTGSYMGTVTSQTSIRLLNATHPIATGLSGGVSGGTLYFAGSSMLHWGKPASTAISIVGLSSDSTKSAVFAYDKGAQMVGLTAPARRVAFMLDDTSMTRASDTWWTSWMLDAAINWATTGN
jgi:hypothetical protein